MLLSSNFHHQGVVVPPTNYFIMSETLIRSFRHLEHQNPSINLGDIGRARSVQQFRRNGTEQRNTVDTMSVWIKLLVEYNTAECPLKLEGIFKLKITNAV